MKSKAIEEMNLERDMVNEASELYFNFPNLRLFTSISEYSNDRLVKNDADLFRRAFVVGVKSKSAEAYWKYKLKYKDDVENDNQ